MHLASFVRLGSTVPDKILVSTWDGSLANAALKEGFDLAHDLKP